ncbi:MAG: helix-turn-helix transcriptional regulator [Firmicutes bacterium]|nr:helix-turn-helix transcriptional regulator [Bacillota bacterium]
MSTLVSARLKECRVLKNAKHREAAEAVGVTLGTYQRYESGDREPSLAVLSKIADYYNVSIDYLLGRSDSFERQ